VGFGRQKFRVQCKADITSGDEVWKGRRDMIAVLREKKLGDRARGGRGKQVCSHGVESQALGISSRIGPHYKFIFPSKGGSLFAVNPRRTVRLRGTSTGGGLKAGREGYTSSVLRSLRTIWRWCDLQKVERHHSKCILLGFTI